MYTSELCRQLSQVDRTRTVYKTPHVTLRFQCFNQITSLDTLIVIVELQLALLLWERVYRSLLSKWWFPQIQSSIETPSIVTLIRVAIVITWMDLKPHQIETPCCGGYQFNIPNYDALCPPETLLPSQCLSILLRPCTASKHETDSPGFTSASAHGQYKTAFWSKAS
jgi:hypothetical protein